MSWRPDASRGWDVPIEARADDGVLGAVCIRSFVGRILLDSRGTQGASTVCLLGYRLRVPRRLPVASAWEA